MTEIEIPKHLYWIPRERQEESVKPADMRPDSEEWTSQDLHLFVVTDVGKPVYFRYGTAKTISPILCTCVVILEHMKSILQQRTLPAHKQVEHPTKIQGTLFFKKKMGFKKNFFKPFHFVAFTSCPPVLFIFTSLHICPSALQPPPQIKHKQNQKQSIENISSWKL